MLALSCTTWCNQVASNLYSSKKTDTNTNWSLNPAAENGGAGQGTQGEALPLHCNALRSIGKLVQPVTTTAAGENGPRSVSATALKLCKFHPGWQPEQCYVFITFCFGD